MTPKEKAQELIEKFIELTPVDYCMSDTVDEVNRKALKDFDLCKQCALIAVDEIIKNGNLEHQLKRHIGNVPPLVIHLEYWFEVKQEIEKL